MQDLDSLPALDALLASSRSSVLLYKHSTQCGLCDRAIQEVRAFEGKHPAAAAIFYLDLWAHRDVSDAVARKLGVRHESPQAILLKDGKVAAVFNHRAIRADALVQAVQAASDSASQKR
jgi:bacillithiol system protein YtxJ